MRDGDEHIGVPLNDEGIVKRFRFNCRSAENLLLADDTLALARTTWDEVKARLDGWLSTNERHPQFRSALQLRDGGWNRRAEDIKQIRNLLVAMIGTQKPWEVAVGQAIAALSRTSSRGENSLATYLGESLIAGLGLCAEGT